MDTKEIILKDLYRETVKELFESPVFKLVLLDLSIKEEVEIRDDISAMTDVKLTEIAETENIIKYIMDHRDEIPGNIQALAHTKLEQRKSKLSEEEDKIIITNRDKDIYNYMYLSNEIKKPQKGGSHGRYRKEEQGQAQ